MADALTADDKAAIMGLIADYAFRVDSGDVDGYVNNFAPDGVFQGGSSTQEGAEAIRAYVQHLVDIGQIGGGPGTRRHFMGLPLIRGDAERVRAETQITWPGPTEDGGLALVRAGRYVDDIVKINGEWKFARRTVETDLI